jgi:hypothetical protein
MPFGLQLNFPLQFRPRTPNVGSPAFDIDDPLTALRYLGSRLDTQVPEMARLDLYYDGNQPIAFLSPEVKEAVGERLHNICINWPALKINSLEERLDVTGFRLPNESTFERAWDIWQANNMDEQSQQAHVESLLHGRSAAIVWGNDDGSANISVESPRQVIVYRDPRTRKATHALKRWVENDGFAYSVLYDDKAVRTYRSKSSNADTSDLYSDPSQVSDLSHVQGWDKVDEVVNRLGQMPLVPLVNRPRVLQPDGISELGRTALDLADAVNKLATDMMVSSEFHAMPRRWATGVELEEDEDGNIKEFSPIKGRTWTVEDSTANIGQLPEADLRNFIEGMSALATHFAATSGLPMKQQLWEEQGEPLNSQEVGRVPVQRDQPGSSGSSGSSGPAAGPAGSAAAEPGQQRGRRAGSSRG